MAEDWGVTDVTIRYHAKGRTWEVSLDPEKIDILVFNWKHYERIVEVLGHPVTKDRHILPDGRSVEGKPAEDVAREMGLKGPPREIGPAEAGTSLDPICFHQAGCQWWCFDETHNHF
jgi:hypothetical protein